MQKFYRLREAAPEKSKLEALREAQLELLRGSVKRAASAAPVHATLQETAGSKADAPRFQVDPRSPYAPPYYWAPFFPMGNWL
jgi:CHAT domain-containing protein